MTGEEFIATLRESLKGMSPGDIDDIVADYRAHLAEGVAAGRAEADVARALGEPARLARELRAEAGLRQWESRRTPGTFARAVVALFGLAALDLLVLLPALFFLLVFVFAASVALVAITVAGLALVFAIGDFGTVSAWTEPVSRVLAGLGLVSGGIGWGAVLLLVLGGVLKLLGRYARLHYRLITPANQGA